MIVTAIELCSVLIDPEGIKGFLGVPEGALGLVVFARGGGSGRLSPRNNYVAAMSLRRWWRQLCRAGGAPIWPEMRLSMRARRRNSSSAVSMRR